MPIEWTKNLESGIPIIDSQHKLLIKKLGELLVACQNGAGKEEAGEMLDFLMDYCSKHFEQEEQYMRESSWPRFLSHVKQHREFKSLITEMTERIETEEVTSDVVVRLNKALVAWFIGHIKKTDLNTCEHLKSNHAKTPAGA